MLNQTIDGYEITQEIGRGHAAAVYAARQQPVGRYVAIKVFDHLTPDSNARLKQLFDQVEVFDQVNILPLYARGSIDERNYWVMRYMSAGSLARSRAPIEQVNRWVAQIAAALSYAHEHQVIHGGLKPSNVLLDHAGNAFVCDFGLAQITGSSQDDYTLPEQRREFTPTVRSDVYALGALTYELITGRSPTRSMPRGDDQANRRITLPPLPSSINSKLSPAIDAVIMKALAIDPEQRFGSAQEFAEAFAQARGVDGSAVPVATKTQSVKPQKLAQPQRSQLDRRWLMGGLIGLLIVAGLIALFSARSNLPATAITDTPTSIPTKPIDTPTVTALPTPTFTPTKLPSPTPTISVSGIISLRPTIKPTATRFPTTTFRPTATPALTISIQPLALLQPRHDGPNRLELYFSTFVAPANAGPIGLLSMSVQPIEPLIIDREEAQLEANEQVARLSITIRCDAQQDAIETNEVVLSIRNQQGRVIYSQVLEYHKTWCS